MSARDKAIETAMQRAVCTTEDLTHRVPVLLSELARHGLAVLPVKPTHEMDERAVDAIAMEVAVIGEGIEIAEGAPGRILRAMLAAASEDSTDA